MKYFFLLFLFSNLAFSETITIKPGMEITTPTPFPTPTPVATATVTPTAEQTVDAEVEDGRTWNEKLAGMAPKPVVKKAALEEDTAALEAETKKMEQELAEVQKELSEKGASAILTNPEFAKKVINAMSGGKNGKGMKSPFAGVSDDEIKNLIKLRVKDTPVEQFLIDHPKLLEFIVRFFKDDKAFLSIMKIPTQEKKLKIYLAVVVFLILLSFFFNLVGSKKSPFWKRLLRKLVVTIFILCCQFAAIYYFFSAELEPTIKIAKDVFFT